MQDGDFANQNRVLTSWKEIAAYLGKGVRTVQRWEKDFALPIRRPNHADKSAILARTRDLDIWVAMRCSTRDLPGGQENNHRLLALRSSLLAGVTTAHLLRETNLTLLAEMQQALLSLRDEIARMRGDARISTADEPDMDTGPLTLTRNGPIIDAA